MAGELRPVLDWRRAQNLVRNPQNLPRGFYIAPDVAALEARLAEPGRGMLGEAQAQWLRDDGMAVPKERTK